MKARASFCEVRLWAAILLLGFGGNAARAGQFFSVASYNLENYIDSDAGNRPAKSPESKIKVREAIRLLGADVVALQEMGGTNALLELRSSLELEGSSYPFWDAVAGHDTNIHVAVLSRFPIVNRFAHTQDGFVLHGRRFRVSRGFSQLVIEVNPDYRFTLLNAHLKSRRPILEADETELREQEALVLRAKIDAILAAEPRARLIVAGDFNNYPSSISTRSIIGRGKKALIDTRPSERNGDSIGMTDRTIAWTYYYAKEDTYSRVDYILLSPAFAKDWLRNGTHVLAFPNWGGASDHRPILARFLAP